MKKNSNKFIKKFKKFYHNNRIYCILMCVSIICLILILTSIITYFVKQSRTSVYGNRCDEVENYDLTNDLKEVNSYLKTADKVTDFEVRNDCKIIHVDVNVSDDASQEEVSNIANTVLEKISEENKGFYDIQFIMIRPSYDAYLGSKSSTSTVIVWSNSYDVETDDDEESTEE